MKLVLIRHGEPSYENVSERNFIGQGRDLAELTDLGVAQAEKAANDSRLQGAEIILSSPYTRALQTAAIISKKTGLDIKVETDLHEWIPDLTFQYSSTENFKEIGKELKKYNGEWNAECKFQWESLSSIGERAFRVIRKYMNYDKVIVVCHGMVIRRFVRKREIENCEIFELDFDEYTKWNGYVE
jgi:broad specificity phosphatase PhoE